MTLDALSLMERERFLKLWRESAKRLGLRAEFERPIRLSNDRTYQCPLLLKEFGGSNGMIVTPDHEDFLNYAHELTTILGYGFSVFPAPTQEELGDLNTVIYFGITRALADWTWSGPPEDRPAWLDEAEKANLLEESEDWE